MSNESEIDNYFKGDKISNETNSYYGNPNYLNILDNDKTYKDITLSDLGFTPEKVKFELKGMVDDLKNPTTGEDYTDDDYNNLISLYVSQTESTFDIVIKPRIKIDRADYYRNDFNAYMYIRTEERPIIHVENVKIYFNNTSILDYDDSWIKVSNRMGQVQIQPALFVQSYARSYQSPFGMPGKLFGVPEMVQGEFAPQMIGLSYIAGMLPRVAGDENINRDIYPRPELIAYVSKLAASAILVRWGRNIIGPGIASYGVSMDGISSQLNTTQSAEYSATKAEVDTLAEELGDLKAQLKNYYGGTNIGIIV